jgi:hypothetical protein
MKALDIRTGFRNSPDGNERPVKPSRAVYLKRRIGALAAVAALGVFGTYEARQIGKTNAENALTEQLAKPITEVHDELMSGKIDAGKIKVIEAPVTATPDAEAAAINPNAYNRQGMAEDILAQEGPMVQKGDPLVLPVKQLPKK